MNKRGSTDADGRLEARISRLRSNLLQLVTQLSPRERLHDGFVNALLVTIAALVAYLPTQAFGLREGFWAAITAIFVAQSEFGASRATARDQFTGAAIGSVVSTLVIVLLSRGIPGYVVAAALSILCTWLLNVPTAARLAGVTVTILLLVPHQDSVEIMMLSRIIEVCWGICAALATVWVATRINRRW